MKNNWQEFVQQEIDYFTPILNDLGFTIDDDQPHTKGERGSFRAKKIILLGSHKSNNKQVVIKCARYEEGINELLEEKQARENIKKIDFAYHEFLEPDETYFNSNKNYTIQITEFIREEVRFTERDPKQQFDIIYRSFVVQEGIHAVTRKHNKQILEYFKVYNFEDYRKQVFICKEKVTDFLGSGLDLLENTEREILQNKYRINQYCGFLTHTEFVPHNFRVRDNQVYLLDHSAIIIGNKHDGWARFLNWAVLHAPIIEKWFEEYFKINRSLEEQESLRLMRLVRLFELAAHHSKIYFASAKDKNLELKELSQKRVYFWLEVMKAVFENREVDRQIVEDYKNDRDSLRTQSEKERQQVIY